MNKKTYIIISVLFIIIGILVVLIANNKSHAFTIEDSNLVYSGIYCANANLIYYAENETTGNYEQVNEMPNHDYVGNQTASHCDSNNCYMYFDRYESDVNIVPFSSGTDAEIKAMLDAYYADEITWEQMGWNVGDTRLIHLNEMQAPSPYSGTWAAQDITIVIVAHDHTDLATPINGHTKAVITVQTREVMNNENTSCHQINSNGPGTTTLNGHIYVDGNSDIDSTFTKWSNLYLRTYLNSTILGAIPAGDFKSSIKQSNHYRHTTYNGSQTELITDTLFLPSAPEVAGTSSYGRYADTSPNAEGTQFSYYETASNRIKYGNNNGSSNGVAHHWWTSSPASYYHSSYYYRWCAVDNTNPIDSYYGNSALGLAPAWVM